MDDPRDPREAQGEAQNRQEAEPDEAVGRIEPEGSAEEAAAPQPPDEPADEFESQPSFATEHDAAEDATAEWPATDQAQQPPPVEAETYSAPPAEGFEERAPDAEERAPSEVEAYASQVAAADEGSATAAAHTVPATGVGESTQCPRCGTENRPGLAFCRNCGQRLMAAGAAATVERPGTPDGTQACPRCGTHNRAGTAFCQNCGANLRAAETAAAGYVPPSVAREPVEATRAAAAERRHAILGPVVLLIGAIGLATGWLLPFPYGAGSLYERAMGSGGYGVGFWDGYSTVDPGLIPHAYFGFAAPVPLLVLLVVVLAIAGIVKASPGRLQGIGLAIALVWSIGLAVLFVAVEVFGGAGSGLADMLRSLTPGGIILFLASLIVLIGTLTRFARG